MGPSDPTNCASKVQIDNLLYTLIPGTPRLQKIADSAPSANRAKGFNPGTASSSAVYQYDKNGNLTTDPYKGLTIQYNFLNLPRLVTKGAANITIRYDASGRKWSQTGTEGIREYVGGIEYVDQKIQSVQHGEGRLVATYNAGGTTIESIRAEYWRQDHLGNVRVAFSDFNLDGVIATKDDPNTPENDVEITQENHYYPFGLNHEGPWYQTVQPKNNYTYNGKEYVEDLGLNWNDYGVRWYDAAVGRWNVLDLLSEAMTSMSPYNYCFGNPVSFVDPIGTTPSLSIYGTDVMNEKSDELSKRMGALKNQIDDRLKSTDFALYILNTIDPQLLTGKDLQSILWYASDIFARNGFDNIKYTFINESQAENLQINNTNIFLKLRNGFVGEDWEGGLYDEIDQKGTPGKERSFVNFTYYEVSHRTGESKNYALGYLIAHESLHTIVVQSFRAFGGSWNEVKGHFNSSPNLLMDGGILYRQYGGIPVGPSNSQEFDPKESISRVHVPYVKRWWYAKILGIGRKKFKK